MNTYTCSSISPALAETPLVLSLDVGTSSARAMIFDRLGRAVEGLMARRPHSVTMRRDGTHETDADHLLELLFECIDEVYERAGERSPGWRGDMRGASQGLSMATQPAEIARAALEGIAYRIGQVYALLRPALAEEPLVVINGGAVLQSPAWIQIIADVLNKPLHVSLVKEASARGAALLGLNAMGVLNDFQIAPDCLGKVYEPDPARHALYAAAMQRQEDLYAQAISNLS